MKTIAAVVFMSTLIFSQSGFNYAGDVVSHKKNENVIEIQLTNALMNIYIIDDNIIRFRYTKEKKFSEAPSYAVIEGVKQQTEYEFAENEKAFQIVTAELKVDINKKPARVSIYDKNGNLINEDEPAFGVSFDGDEVRCHKKLLDNEKFYGLGEKTGGLEKRGNQYTMWNTDFPAYEWRTDPLYVSIPFFIGVKDKKAYGIFFDNTYRSYFNMGASSNRYYWFGAVKGEMDYYFIYGPEIKKVITSYTSLTGKMEMPPLWSLGYQQSKWSYYPESTVKTLAKNFRDKNIPCDVIYFDIHYMDGYRVFTWDKERFPNPSKMLRELKEQGFKVVPIIDPGVKADNNYFAAKEGLAQDLFAKYPDGEVYQGEVWPSWAYFPDFTKKATRDWWGDKLSVPLKEGIEGFWNDMNEPAVWGQAFPDIVQFDDNGFKSDHKKIHNVYALQMAKATFEGLKKHSPNKRHFILTRAGFAGIQRYSSVWTGDNLANEDHLRLACLMTQSLGLSGVPFAGSDVGGFMDYPSQRLYTRWMQLGAFTPFFRGHSAINYPDKEPWAFGEDVERWVKDAISMRYKLMPLLYNEFYNASQTGLPVMKPMFLEFQNDENCYTWDAQFQFMIGENLLVAPVVYEKDNIKKLYLPEGKWMNFWTKEIYNGSQWIIVDAPIWQIPLFIKEGGIIPMQEVLQYTGEKEIEQLELLVFPSKENSFTLYEDDGISYNYKKGNYSKTEFSIKKKENELVFTCGKLDKQYLPARKSFLVRLFDVSEVKEVVFDGKKLKEISTGGDLKNSKEGYSFTKKEKELIVIIPSGSEFELVVR